MSKVAFLSSMLFRLALSNHLLFGGDFETIFLL